MSHHNNPENKRHQHRRNRSRSNSRERSHRRSRHEKRREKRNNKYDSNHQMKCYNCNQYGHKAFNCPLKKNNNKTDQNTSNNLISNPLQCYSCKKTGHKSHECPNKKVDNDEKENIENKNGCYNCGETSHKARECSKPRRVRHSRDKYNSRNNKRKYNSNFNLPKWWTTKIEDDSTNLRAYDLVKENKINTEVLSRAKKAYLLTMPNDKNKITNIWVVQNQFFWEQHKSIEKGWMEHKFKNDKKKCNIKYLFHGTDGDIIKNEILSNDFNRIYNKTHAYGKGVYFARDSRYSMNGYSKKDKNGYKWLLYCRVLCGESCIGTSTMMEPNKKPNGIHRYETMVDKLHNSSIYVTPKDKQAYPLVLFQIQA